MRRLFFGLILLTSVLACQPQPEQPFSVVNPGAVTLAPLPQLPETAVRGAWLTTTDSRVLDSRAGIEAAVRNCEALGINTLFVVVWGNGTTFYPSQIMQNLTGTSINARFAGRDPLRELIEVARPRGIKVFAWFEYGFAASFSAQGGALVRARPQWAALGTNGQLVVKNGFDWLNALDPEVQDFMLSLVLEVVRNYEVDGIQGDDRLPALPVEAGYNPAVAAAYRAETGQDPPPNFRDPAWVRWRAARLSGFAQRLYSQVKAARRNCLVAMSPSVFPFSREEYLQDWPTWVANGHADL
ncbi:MAG: family 10 glycosylhydrolase, partial [Bernardetiaceae bacterium]|nr:family 10 glycosylhydrolase [Bernardetiaceae bacterium]